jgi:aryl-alcohol dehydrogenase-like predicted oxidoreductase
LTWTALELLAFQEQAPKGRDGMKTVELGTTGTQVSQLALGAMLMGTSTDETTSVRMFEDFVASGGTFLDTANCSAWWHSAQSTGHESQELLGRWFEASGRRGHDPASDR